MEKITYNIIGIGNNMCRIVCNDVRTKFRKYADGGCICSLEVLIYEMQSINNACRMNNANAVYEFFGDF